MISQIRDIAAQLQAAYPKDEAESLAWWMMEEETGLSRTQIQFGCKSTQNFANMQIFEPIIARLLHFEPIQYIFGHTLWCGLDLKVTPATLIPRPETAELVERIQNTDRFTDRIQTDNASLRVLDIGTGSGCIAIALKKAHPEWQVTGIDISPETIEVARENARRNNVEVDFQVADIFDSNEEPVTGKWSNGKWFDIVVSNPPYICESEKSQMRRNVLDYEPETALFVPDDDPLKFYRRIAKLFSIPSGRDRVGFLFFEINEAYPKEMEAMLQEEGYTDIKITNDIYGKPRIVEARMA